MVAALKFSVIAGNGPQVFFKPLGSPPDMGIFILNKLSSNTVTGAGSASGGGGDK